MDDQQLHGISIVNFQQSGKLRCLCHTQPGFQGDGQGRIRKNAIQKPLQSIRVPEQPGAFSFGKHCAGGAAQVQIDLPVASVSALLRRPEKILYGFRQQLRHRLKVHSVRHGQFPGFPGCQRTVDRGGQEGHIIFIDTTEVFMVQRSIDAVGKPLHGSKIYFHIEPQNPQAETWGIFIRFP